MTPKAQNPMTPKTPPPKSSKIASTRNFVVGWAISGGLFCAVAVIVPWSKLGFRVGGFRV